MQKLIVRNFGPIKELDLDIKDLSLFIGEQATGKSTVAKLVYFFKKVVKDELISYLYLIPSKEVSLEKGFMEIRYGFKDDVESNLFKLFNALSDSFQIDYKYKEKTWLHIDNLNTFPKTLKLTFTATLHEFIEADFGDSPWDNFYEISKEIIEFRKKYLSGEIGFQDFERDENRIRIRKIINDFLGEDIGTKTIFIPAGRNMLTALSERLPNKGWDFLMEEFRDKITDLKPLFHQSLQSLISDKKQRGNNMPSAEILEQVLKNIKGILKGEYKVDKDGEKLYFDDKQFVKMSLASSGQQEALWILLQLFILILNKEKVFLIIEEPEAHLFPQAQKSLVELITLLFNQNNSQIIITTHSPYILTSFNNLIYAGNIGKEYTEVREVIPKLLWIDNEKVGAYRLANGTTEDLMDDETHLIRAEAIDTVSQSINHDFDALLNLELQ